MKPTADEQYMLELVNRARQNPLAEANLFGIDLNQGLTTDTITSQAKQPLAFNQLLIDAARAHSQWMLDTDTFSHTGINNTRAGDRIADAGYQFTDTWGWGENIAWIGTSGDLDSTEFITREHENLFKSPSHRINILADDFQEIGIGSLQGEFEDEGVLYNTVMTTQNFANSGTSFFLTGVVYDDLVLDDNFYTVGEGIGDITVEAVRRSDQSRYTTTTFDSGGYQIALDPGTYDVIFGSDGSDQTYTSRVTVADQNVKLDLATDSLANFTANFAPSQLQFKLQQSGKRFSLSDAWVYDNDGSDDLARVDMWLLTPQQQWIELNDVTEFNPWNQQSSWSSFEYSFNLQNNPTGNYTLWAAAYDQTGTASNVVTQQFQLGNSAPGQLQFNLKQSGNVVSFDEAWIKDSDGNDDLAGVDMWLLTPQQQWLELDDVTNFKAWDGEWSSFDYSLDLSGYENGTYSFWAQGYDISGAKSNAAIRSFEHVASQTLSTAYNHAPGGLQFDLQQSGNTLKLHEAWIQDRDGNDDLAKVDMWLLTPTNQWIDLEDVSSFRAWDQEWSSFDYSLNLGRYDNGSYTLWAAAYDLSGAISNVVEADFMVNN